MASHKKFVLDTNVLIHDPNALSHFDEHDVVLPMVVLEEMDKVKRGVDEILADENKLRLGSGKFLEYDYLPMGLRVLRNIETIIREEMNRRHWVSWV